LNERLIDTSTNGVANYANANYRIAGASTDTNAFERPPDSAGPSKKEEGRRPLNCRKIYLVQNQYIAAERKPRNALPIQIPALIAC
jgi:hypothetical protein